MENLLQSLFSMAARQPAYLNIVKQEQRHGLTTGRLAAVPIAVTNTECNCKPCMLRAVSAPQSKPISCTAEKLKKLPRSKEEATFTLVLLKNVTQIYRAKALNTKCEACHRVQDVGWLQPLRGSGTIAVSGVGCAYLRRQKNLLHLPFTHSLGFLFHTSRFMLEGVGVVREWGQKTCSTIHSFTALGDVVAQWSVLQSCQPEAVGSSPGNRK